MKSKKSKAATKRGVVSATACSGALQAAALEYESATGFEPLNYNGSAGKPLKDRYAALKQDLKWFEDHANEAQCRVWSEMKNCDV